MNPSDSQRVYLKQLYMYMGLLMYTQSALLRMEPGVITERKGPLRPHNLGTPKSLQIWGGLEKLKS